MNKPRFTVKSVADRDAFIEWVANISLSTEDTDFEKHAELDTATLDSLINRARNLAVETKCPTGVCNIVGART